MRYLVDELKLDPDVLDLMGDTALHDAARLGHEEVVRILLDAGTDINLVNSAGMNAQLLAVEYGKDEVAPLIGSAG